jgi:hypothetical protein
MDEKVIELRPESLLNSTESGINRAQVAQASDSTGVPSIRAIFKIGVRHRSALANLANKVSKDSQKWRFSERLEPSHASHDRFGIIGTGVESH